MPISPGQGSVIAAGVSAGMGRRGQKKQAKYNKKAAEVAFHRNQKAVRQAHRRQRQLNRTAYKRTRKLSSTSHQRASEDLRKAGLNRILAVTQGGASSAGISGGSAQAATAQAAAAPDLQNIGPEIMKAGGTAADVALKGTAAIGNTAKAALTKGQEGLIGPQGELIAAQTSTAKSAAAMNKSQATLNAARTKETITKERAVHYDNTGKKVRHDATRLGIEQTNKFRRRMQRKELNRRRRETISRKTGSSGQEGGFISNLQQLWNRRSKHDRP